MSIRFSRMMCLASIGEDAGETWVGFASIDRGLKHWSEVTQLRVLYGQFSDANRQRCDRYRSAARQAQFLLARLLALHVLKNGLRVSIDGVEVNQLPSGRPVLDRSCKPMEARISIAHSGNVAAVAVSTGCVSAGIDIEMEDRLNADAMRFMLGDVHASGIDNCGDECGKESERELRSEWLRRESAWKALGGPDDVSVLTLQLGSQMPNDPSVPDSMILGKRPIFTLMSSGEIPGVEGATGVDSSASESSFVACVCQIRD